MHQSWKDALRSEFRKPYFIELAKFLDEERAKSAVMPPNGEVFTAFDLTPFDQVRVVILGQDPYPTPGHAHGLAFSVKPGVEVPRSLKNIYRELAEDLGVQPPTHGNLRAWAERGVFLLNTCLTVRAHEPNSHAGRGWETFTDAVIRALDAREEPLVFILWGANARKKAALLDTVRHTILQSAHPSPLSANAGFFGSKPFSRANEALRRHGLSEIDWDLR